MYYSKVDDGGFEACADIEDKELQTSMNSMNPQYLAVLVKGASSQRDVNRYQSERL